MGVFPSEVSRFAIINHSIPEGLSSPGLVLLGERSNISPFEGEIEHITLCLGLLLYEHLLSGLKLFLSLFCALFGLPSGIQNLSLFRGQILILYLLGYVLQDFLKRNFELAEKAIEITLLVMLAKLLNVANQALVLS